MQLRSLLVLVSVLSCTVVADDDIVTLKFGDDIGDNFGPYLIPDSVTPQISLLTNYSFFGQRENFLYISENGVVSFGSPMSAPFAEPLPIPTSTSTTPFIAGYWGDVDVMKNGGAILYREMDATWGAVFCEQRVYVMKLLREGFGAAMEGFDPTNLFVITWDGVHGNMTDDDDKQAVTFQIVLVTDSKTSATYVLLLYSDVRWDIANGHRVLVGFNAGDGIRAFTHPLSLENRLLELDDQTNARRPGVFVYRVDLDTVIEPTEEQRNEEICALVASCEDVSQPSMNCSCESEDLELQEDSISCKAPLKVELFNNTPLVMGNNVRVNFHTNRPEAVLYCQLMRVDRRRSDCSSGEFYRSGLEPKGYSLRITAVIPGTSQKVILRANFRIQEEDKVFCSVSIINRSTASHTQNATIEFVGSEHVERFYCRTDKDKRSLCVSPYVTKPLSPGTHRIVITPVGCGRDRKQASLQVTVS